MQDCLLGEQHVDSCMLFSVVLHGLLKAFLFLMLKCLTKVAIATYLSSRTRMVLSLQEATISVRVQRFDCEGFVIVEDLCDGNILLSLRLLLVLSYQEPQQHHSPSSHVLFVAFTIRIVHL